MEQFPWPIFKGMLLARPAQLRFSVDLQPSEPGEDFLSFGR